MQEKMVIWAMEEIEVINPVLESYRAQGVNMSLSLPADTLFTP